MLNLMKEHQLGCKMLTIDTFLVRVTLVEETLVQVVVTHGTQCYEKKGDM